MPIESDPDLETRIIDYLEACLTDGEAFTKSKYIADALDVSVKRVGIIMAALEDGDARVDVHRWGGSSDGITWRIEPATHDE